MEVPFWASALNDGLKIGLRRRHGGAVSHSHCRRDFSVIRQAGLVLSWVFSTPFKGLGARSAFTVRLGRELGRLHFVQTCERYSPGKVLVSWCSPFRNNKNLHPLVLLLISMSFSLVSATNTRPQHLHTGPPASISQAVPWI